jgi:hypothetical protein
MRTPRGVVWAYPFLAALLLACASSSRAQTAPAASRPITFTVTSVDGEGAQPLSKADVQLFLAGERRPIESWSEGKELHLAILIDDAVASDVTRHFEDLRELIRAQPETTRVAVGYLRDNVTTLAQGFTTNHEAAANALRAPAGVGGRSSPYKATIHLLQRWPESGPRRSILLISPGVDFRRGERVGPVLPEVAPLIDLAQQLNTNIWTVFYPGGGHRGRNFTHVTNGQENLSHLAEATGAEFFASGPGAPVSLKGYLDEIAAHLGHQRLLTFTAGAVDSARHVEVDVRTERPGAQLLLPSAVYLPGR